MKIRFLVLGCLCLYLFFVCGCIQRDQMRTEKSTITILYPWDERVLGPYYDVTAKFLVFLPLFTSDESGHIQGKLAESWDASEDYREWTFHLHKNVKWHDGTPVTAHDIKFTLELISSPEVLFDDGWSGMQSITVHNDYSFTVTFKFAKDFSDDWLVYWPKHILEKLDPKQFWEWDFWIHPIGNGPYRYVRHTPQTLIEFSANPDFFLGEPRIKQVMLKFGSSSPLFELQSGNVDALTFFKRSDIPKLEKYPQFRSYYQHPPNIAWLSAIHWNLKDPLFSDPKVRQALTMAIDRKKLLAVIYMPEELKIFDSIFTGHLYRHDGVPPPLPYDPKKASLLLEEAGWKDRDKNGFLEKDGQNFRFTAIFPPGAVSLGDYENAAVYIQSQFRQIGVRMEIQSLGSTLVLKRMREGQFQAAFSRFFQLPLQVLRWLGENSPSGYDNPQLTNLLEELKITADPEEINRIYSIIMPIFSNDIPLTFLFPTVNTYIVHNRIKGLSSPYRADPVLNMEHLWIEEDEKN